jgi:hypothetical protein
MTDPASLLDEVSGIDACIKVAGGRIILRAGSQPIPANLVQRIRRAKRELSEFIVARALYRENDAALPLKHIIHWLNEHPAPSRIGECAWCGKPESRDGTVLPFGTEPGTHTWLHAECWLAWHQARRRQAIIELARGQRTDTSAAARPAGHDGTGSEIILPEFGKAKE